MQASEPVLVYLKLSAGISATGYRAALWTDLPAPGRAHGRGASWGGGGCSLPHMVEYNLSDEFLIARAMLDVVAVCFQLELQICPSEMEATIAGRQQDPRSWMDVCKPVSAVLVRTAPIRAILPERR